MTSSILVVLMEVWELLQLALKSDSCESGRCVPLDQGQYFQIVKTQQQQCHIMKIQIIVINIVKSLCCNVT